MSDEVDLGEIAARMRYCGQQHSVSEKRSSKSKKHKKNSVFFSASAANSKSSAASKDASGASSVDTSVWVRNERGVWVRGGAAAAVSRSGGGGRSGSGSSNKKAVGAVAPDYRHHPDAKPASVPSSLLDCTAQQASSSWSITNEEYALVCQRAEKLQQKENKEDNNDNNNAGSTTLILNFEDTTQLFQMIRLFGAKFLIIADRWSLFSSSSSSNDSISNPPDALQLQAHFGLVVSLLAELRYEQLQSAVNQAREQRKQIEGAGDEHQENKTDVGRGGDDDNDAAAVIAENQRKRKAAASTRALETAVLALAREHPVRHQSAVLGTAAEAGHEDREAIRRRQKEEKKNDGADGDNSLLLLPLGEEICIPPSATSAPLVADSNTLQARQALLQKRVDAIDGEDCLGHALSSRFRTMQTTSQGLSGRVNYPREEAADITDTGLIPSEEATSQLALLADKLRGTVPVSGGGVLAQGEVATTIDDEHFLNIPLTLKLRTSRGPLIGYASDLEKYLEARLTPLVSTAGAGVQDQVDALRATAMATTVTDREAIRVRNTTANMRRVRDEADALRREMLLAATEKAAGPTRRHREE